jgi:predicted metal-binding membrane protein
MKLRLTHGREFVLRAVIVAGCLAAVLFALVLSAIPQLHEQVHGGSTTVNHECAVTLLTAGKYQHTVTPTICLVPPTPPAAFTRAPDSFFLVAARLEFSLLEHAPPAAS